jgi:hypothetical protein
VEDAPPYTVTVWSKEYTRRGRLAGLLDVQGAIRVGAPGEATFTVSASNIRVPDLGLEGARAVIEYRYSPTSASKVLISGSIEEVQGTGAGPTARRTYRVSDDWNLFNDVLGWPNPTGAITAQGADTAYFRRSGPAETVLKQIVSPNLTRLGIPVTVPATQGRGSSVTAQIRMHTLAEILFPLVTTTGKLGVRIVQVGAERVLDVWVPTTYPRVLTQESGVIQEGEFQKSPPTVTRVVIGAGGEGVKREFRLYVATGLEALYGSPGKPYVRERFVDARDAASEVTSAEEQKAETGRTLATATTERRLAGYRYDAAVRHRNAAAVVLDQAKDYLADHAGLQRAIDRRDQAQTVYNDAVADVAEKLTARTDAQTALDEATTAAATATQAVVTARAAYEIDLQTRAAEALAEGEPRAGLSVKLSETENFRYGKTFELGDRVSLRLAGSPVLTDYVREVQFRWDDSGSHITPIVGDWEESTMSVILAAVSRTIRDVSDLQRSL